MHDVDLSNTEFESVVFDRCDLSRATTGLGDIWEIERTAIKPFAACHFTHGAIDAALVVRARVPDPDAIRAVQVLVPADVVST
ncbi:MAG: hypothetical protein ACTS8Z_09140, partial [Candidatus Limnocylindrales bacterium]